MVMTLGLATVSSSAAYSDAADVSLEEAVDVMSAVGVFQGADGKFSPKANLNREQAAKLIAYLDLGETAAEALPAVKVFSDVPATSWSAKYIAYCADAGYIVGDGTGKFNPTGELNGYAFGKMLLCVLGYDASIEGFTGNNWSISVAKLMQSNKIAKGISTAASATLTREQAAQYCFNTIQQRTVNYANKGTQVTINGAVIATGASAANKDGNPLLKDKLYNDSVVATAASGLFKKTTDVTDDFGRKSYSWRLDNKEIDVYTDSAAVVYTAGMNTTDGKKTIASDLAGYKFDGVELKNTSTLASSAISAYHATNNPDGVVGLPATINQNANLVDAIAGWTANGKTVEIYANSDKEVTQVVVIEYKVGTVTTLDTGKKAANGSVRNVYKVTPVGGTASNPYYVYTDAKNDESDTAVVYDGIAKKDFVTYTIANNKLYVYPTTTVTGKQTAKSGSKITVDGTAYTVALGVKDSENNVAMGDFANSNTARNFYLDQFGYVVASDEVEEETNYAIINAIVKNSSLTDTIEAELIFMDGTTKKVEVAELKLADNSNADVKTNKNNNAALTQEFCTYSVKSDGTYKLKIVPTDETVKSAVKKTTSSQVTEITKNGSPVVKVTGGDPATVTVGNSTVFVVKSVNSSGDASYKTYTGYKAVPTIGSKDDAAVTVDYLMDGSTVKFVYVDTAYGATSTAGTSKGDMIFVLGETATESLEGDDTTYYIWDALVNGKETNFKTSATKDSENHDIARGKLYEATTDTNGVVTALAKQTALTSSISDAKDGVLKVGSTNYTYDGEGETVYVIDTDWTVTSGAVSDVKTATTAALYIETETNSDEIKTMYVVLKNEA